MASKLIKKVCLLGDSSVGKTSLVRKYVYDSFDDK
ncbi:MAG: Ras family protein, partial [Thermoplasmata archaeon]|nr:Ras family protein [Thermoplasmata archaeon]